MGVVTFCAEWESTAPHAPHRANIAIRSYEPGVVDTDMQRRARSLSAKELPWGGMFHDFVRRGSIVDATKPAAEIVNSWRQTVISVLRKRVSADMRLSIPWRARSVLVATLVVSISAGAQSDDARSCVARSAPASAAQPAVVPIDVSNNHVFVKVCAGETPLEFILDTGAGASFFDLNHAEQLPSASRSDRHSPRVAPVRDGCGWSGRRRVVSLAWNRLKQPVLAAIDFSGSSGTEGHRVDGVLGFDFISPIRRRDRLREAGDAALRPRLSVPRRGHDVTRHVLQYRPHVDAVCGSRTDRRSRGDMIVDVGSGASLARQAVRRRDHLRERVGQTRSPTTAELAAQAGSRSPGSKDLQLGTLQVRATPIDDAVWRFRGRVLGSRALGGNIGGEILRRFTVFLRLQAQSHDSRAARWDEPRHSRRTCRPGWAPRSRRA